METLPLMTHENMQGEAIKECYVVCWSFHKDTLVAGMHTEREYLMVDKGFVAARQISKYFTSDCMQSVCHVD